MTSTNGPSPGVRSLVNAQRQRAGLLELEGNPGLRASPELVTRLTAAQARLDMAPGAAITLNLGGGPQELRAGDVELLLGLCAEAFERYDTAS